MKNLKLTPKRKEILESLNIDNPLNLLRYYPYRYDCLSLQPLSMDLHEKKVTIQGIICSEVKVFQFYGKKCRTTFKVNFLNEEISVLLFNRFGWSKILKKGNHVVVSGKYNAFKNEIVASSFFVGKLDEKEKWIPIYSLPATIKTQTFQNFIQSIVDYYAEDDKIQNIIPDQFIKKYRLISLKESLNFIHFPKTAEQLRQANRHLKYEELLNFCSLGVLKRQLLLQNGIKNKPKFDMAFLKKVVYSLPFQLSEDQKIVLKEILDDLNRNYCMSRLLQGDVGSGKTIVALLALVANFTTNYQGALMVPTDILARQHYQEFQKILKDFPIDIYLLVSNMSKKEKEMVISLLKENEHCIVIGTHSLIQEQIQFKKLGMAVIDEQHRFGVKQRLLLKEKGGQMDVLYMSATPIPRTLASTLYMDMDVSTIACFPHSGRKVITQFLRSNQIKIIKSKIEEYMKHTNGKVYVVCPTIENSSLDLENVVSIYEKLKKEFKDESCLLLHGKLKSEEKNKVMEEFNQGTCKILVSTTVIEVGINVKNANMMIILNAERFGLAQIHQLRGRIGRDGNVGYCYLCSDQEEEDVIERLEFLSKNDDGFKISEYDLQRRGAGDLLGLRQSGETPFMIANLIDDYAILKAAAQDARFIMNNQEQFKTYYNYIMDCLNHSQKYVD